jgi:hypothetical protein
MKKSVITLGTILTLLALSVSCSHQQKSPEAQRELASKDCNKSRPDYHSYFDNIEKCMDN